VDDRFKFNRRSHWLSKAVTCSHSRCISSFPISSSSHPRFTGTSTSDIWCLLITGTRYHRLLCVRVHFTYLKTSSRVRCVPDGHHMFSQVKLLRHDCAQGASHTLKDHTTSTPSTLPSVVIIHLNRWFLSAMNQSSKLLGSSSSGMSKMGANRSVDSSACAECDECCTQQPSLSALVGLQSGCLHSLPLPFSFSFVLPKWPLAIDGEGTSVFQESS
jgi:hypothetical protein